MHHDAPDGVDASALAAAIGGRVRQERLERGWTLDRLAEAAGVSRRLVVNVEQGAANPSIATLLRLSDALGVSLPALVEPPPPSPVRVTRRGAGTTLWRGESGGEATLVAVTQRPDTVELWEWTLAPGERYAPEAHTAGTRELLLLREGTLRLETGPEVAELSEGDAVSFPGDRDHAYANPGPGPARFTMVVYEPGAAPDRRAEQPRA
jgi:transcriptional regulator with XRE-family HTH domain